MAQRAGSSEQRTESFDSLRLKIHEKYDDLSPQLQKIARAALDDPDTFALETVVVLAAAAGVQPSSLVRFAKAFGYNGFSDLQRIFRLRLIEGAPAYRERIVDHRVKLDAAGNGDPLAILHEFADASALTLDQLKQDVPRESFLGAVELLDGARDIYVIGQRRAFPLAAYFAYGLVRLEFRCHLLDFVGGMVPQQGATMTPEDLLVAISFAEYALPVVDVVKDIYIRGIPILAITDTLASPLAKNSTLAFTLNDADVHRFRPVVAPMTLIQSLIIALSYNRDTRVEVAKVKKRRGSRKRASPRSRARKS